MASRREILTFQCGPFSNGIGAHFWNSQDELCGGAFAHSDDEPWIDNGPMYMETAKGMVPRAVFFDSRGAIELLGSVTHRGRGAAAGAEAFAPTSSRAAWAGPVAVSARPATRLHDYQRDLLDQDDRAAAEQAAMEAAFAEAEASADGGGGGAAAAAAAAASAGWAGHGAGFAPAPEREEAPEPEADDRDYGLDATARGWGDWCKAPLHRRSTVELRGADAGGFGGSAEVGLALASGGAGAEWEDAEAVEDAIRWQLEAADSPQGMIVLCDADGGWGGVGAAVASYLSEECPGAAVLAIPVLGPWRHGGPVGAAAAEAARLPGATVSGMAAAEHASQAAAARRCNVALTWSRLAERSTAVAPLSVQAYVQAAVAAGGAGSQLCWPHWRADPASSYHASAALGHALDLLTTPLRTAGSPSASLRGASLATVPGRMRLGELCAVAAGSAAGAGTSTYLCAGLTLPLPDPFSDPASLAASVTPIAPAPHATAGPWALPLVWPDQPGRVLADGARASARAAGSHAGDGAGGAPLPEGSSPPGEAQWAAADAARAAAEAAGAPLGLLLVSRGHRPPRGAAGEAAAAAAGHAAAGLSTGERGRAVAAPPSVGDWADRWLAESRCSSARHCLWSTPLPVPIPHPRRVFDGDSWTLDGAVSAESRHASERFRRSLRPSTAAATGTRAAPGGKGGAAAAGWERGWDVLRASEASASGTRVQHGSAPETLAAMLRLGAGAEASPSLRWAAASLASPDRRVMHRVLGDDSASAAGVGGGAPDDWRSLAEALSGAADSLGGE
ncbi:hypothetical protein FNF31_06355 [Cafeteria roenbergensis]|uniref:Misato Segment II tubulin-like domain-containing protein n=1 Tax=Cafeteria roenbergensis TaxID=33653 RepID=A0A5A8CNA4_CAFRO|nr:hypothetical protein FNF31_06355 [Cafeteria roenbergensis]